MSKIVLCQMMDYEKALFLERHSFYVTQAASRLLCQFEDMDGDADRFMKNWLAKRSHLYSPEHDNYEDYCDAAYEEGANFVSLLYDMQRQTYLSITAGMFHQWDKELRSWLWNEVRHWCGGNEVHNQIWKVSLEDIIALLVDFRLSARDHAFLRRIEALALVVNVHKHGPGRSLDRLVEEFPEYIDGPFGLDRSHNFLRVTDDQLREFSDAIVEFWEAIPTEVTAPPVSLAPKWFRKAAEKDMSARETKP